MKTITPGRRIPHDGKTLDDVYGLVQQPGDYMGPMEGRPGMNPSVWFLLPIARDKDVEPGGRSLHHVQSPPHVFTEESDGTLTIRESIGAGPPNYYWHGYLTRGVWETCD